MCDMGAVLEIVRARWGKTAHLVFMFFACCTNILVSSMLVLGGAAVVNALTGMDLYAVRHLLATLLATHLLPAAAA